MAGRPRIGDCRITITVTRDHIRALRRLSRATGASISHVARDILGIGLTEVELEAARKLQK